MKAATGALAGDAKSLLAALTSPTPTAPPRRLVADWQLSHQDDTGANDRREHSKPAGKEGPWPAAKWCELLRECLTGSARGSSRRAGSLEDRLPSDLQGFAPRGR